MSEALFLDHEHKLTFEKISMPVKLSDSPEAWQREVASEIYKQVPFLGEYAVNIVIDRVDAERGFAFGSAIVSNKSAAPMQDQQKLPTVRIPIIVKERMLAPLDVFLDGEGVYPLTEKRVREKLFRSATFEASSRKPTDKGLTDQLFPPMRGNNGQGTVGSEALGIGKTAGVVDFFGTLKRNPNPEQLNQAFAAYKKDTGKDSSQMSQAEINSYLDKRDRFSNYPKGNMGGARSKLKDSANQAKVKQANEAEMGRRSYLQRMKSEAAANPTHFAGTTGNPSMGPDKEASLLDAILPTIPDADADAFVDQVTNSDGLKVAANKNAVFSNMLYKIAGVQNNVEKTASALVERIKPTVIQLQKLSSGDFLVKWANAGAFSPQQGVVPPEQAAGMAGADLGNMQPGATVTVGTEKVKKQTLQEEGHVQVDEPGTYKCQNTDTNEPVVGYVMPVTDFEQQPLELFVFVTEGAHAVQDEIAGVRQEGAPPPQALPLQQAQGDGCFVYDVNGKLHALPPITIQNIGQDPSGAVQLHAESVFGEPLTLTMAPELKAIQQVGEQEYAIPGFLQWMLFQGKPIMLAKKPADLDQSQEAKGMPSAVDVGSTGPGEFSMEGAPVDKIAVDQRQFIKAAQAEFLLVAMGVNPFEVKEILKTAQYKKVKLAGLKTLTPLADVHKNMVKKAAQTLGDFPYHLRQNLVKEAAVLEDGSTADKVLALNFLNPENINTFAEYLPELDSTSQKLAETLLATRLGMSQVDEGAVERSIRGIETVIDGLKTLQQGEAAQ